MTAIVDFNNVPTFAINDSKKLKQKEKSPTKKYGVSEEERYWIVKEKLYKHKEERIIAIGRKSIRVLMPGTEEELQTYRWSKIRKFIYRSDRRVFGFEYDNKKLDFQGKVVLFKCGSYFNDVIHCLKVVINEKLLREADKKRKAEQRKSTSDFSSSSKSKSIPNLADLRDPIEPAVSTARPRSRSVSQAPSNADRHIRRNNSLSSANMKRVNSSRKLSYSIIE
jgi:hypothetical protein